MNERISYFDNLKFACILLVVIGHAFVNHTGISYYYGAIECFICLFHMPVFLFVSGIFHNNKNVSNKVVVLFVYLMLAKCISFFCDKVSGNQPDITIFVQRGWDWFLAALIVYAMVSFFLRDINPVFVICVSVLIGCMAGYDNGLMSGKFYGRLITWYPFYYLGSVIDRKKLVGLFEKYGRIKWMPGCLILAAWGGYCIIRRSSIMRIWEFINPTAIYAELPFNATAFSRLLYYCFVIIIGLSFMLIIPTKRTIMTDLGKRTLSVYLLHMLVRSFLYKYRVADILLTSLWGALMYVLLWIVLTVVLSAKLFYQPLSLIKTASYKNENKESNKTE